jgi:hypothetical protein
MIENQLQKTSERQLPKLETLLFVNFDFAYMKSLAQNYSKTIKKLCLLLGTYELRGI